MLTKTTSFNTRNGFVLWFESNWAQCACTITSCCHPHAQHGQRSKEWGCDDKAIIDQ